MVERVLPVGEILQTALHRVQNRLAAGKQTVRLLHESRILVVHDALLAAKEKKYLWKKIPSFLLSKSFLKPNGMEMRAKLFYFYLKT